MLFSYCFINIILIAALIIYEENLFSVFHCDSEGIKSGLVIWRYHWTGFKLTSLITAVG